MRERGGEGRGSDSEGKDMSCQLRDERRRVRDVSVGHFRGELRGRGMGGSGPLSVLNEAHHTSRLYTHKKRCPCLNVNLEDTQCGAPAIPPSFPCQDSL